MTIVIGTRGSKLALWQAGWVRDQLTARGHEVEIKVIKTAGDKLPNESRGIPHQDWNQGALHQGNRGGARGRGD